MSELKKILSDIEESNRLLEDHAEIMARLTAIMGENHRNLLVAIAELERCAQPALR